MLKNKVSICRKMQISIPYLIPIQEESLKLRVYLQHKAFQNIALNLPKKFHSNINILLQYNQKAEGKRILFNMILMRLEQLPLKISQKANFPGKTFGLLKLAVLKGKSFLLTLVYVWVSDMQMKALPLTFSTTEKSSAIDSLFIYKILKCTWKKYYHK